MKNLTKFISERKKLRFILKKYSQMSGDKRVRLGMSLSKAVRDVRSAGIKATGV